MSGVAHPIPSRVLADDERHLWLPPRRLRRYTVNKILAAFIVAAIFTGWLFLQWSVPMMRYLAGGLLAVTLWVLVASIVQDHRRSRGRQIAIEPGSLCIITPQQRLRVPLTTLHHGRWTLDSHRPGLALLTTDDRELALIDLDFLGDEAEARTFLRWLRERTGAALPVDWTCPHPNDSRNAPDDRTER